MQKDENSGYMGQVDKEGEWGFSSSSEIAGQRESGDPNIHCFTILLELF